jgi:hypothetical protein
VIAAVVGALAFLAGSDGPTQFIYFEF